MAHSVQIKLVSFLAIAAAFMTTVVITPNYSSEPVDLPKLLVMVPFCFAAMTTIMLNPKIFRIKNFRPLIVLLFLFLLQSTFVLFCSGSEFNQQFFGASGRNTGLLTYLALVFILFAVTIATDSNLVRRLSLTLLTTGGLSAAYGILQIINHDPVKWNNPYSPMISFLGNPDFASSFLAFSSATAIAFLFSSRITIRVKLVMSILILISVIDIVKSHAQQGLLVLGLIVAMTILIYLYKSENLDRRIAHFSSAIFTLISSLAVLGIFKIGPLSFLYKLSVRQRGFYWHAAIKMMNNHPVFGIGFDSYGDFYFKFRSANAAFHSLNTQSNSAHNVFLDIGSSGGYLLLLAYLGITIYVGYRGFLLLKQMNGFEPHKVAIVLAWLGYEAQSVISINNLGLAIWGWILGGLIVGSSLEEKGSQTLKNVRNQGRKKISNRPYSLVALIGFIIGLFLVVPAFQSDHNYRNALNSRNADQVMRAVTAYPESTSRTTSAALLLLQSKLTSQGLSLAQHVVSINKNSYNAWALIFNSTDPKSQIHQVAKDNLHRLSPLDKNFA